MFQDMKATPEQHRRVLDLLDDLPHDAEANALWHAVDRSDWPALFHLLDLAADLPRLATNPTFDAFSGELWPELDTVRCGLYRLQELVDQPIVPPGARPAAEHGLDGFDEAVRELEETHCVHMDFLLEPEQRLALDAEVAELGKTRMGSWGELERDSSPGLYEIFESGLGSERFRRLSGFDLERDEYTLTLSLQDLDSGGIGWHRDLYWPKEWVGEDVFAVLYALGTDTPELGGAFVHYVPWHNEVCALYRKRHQATVMWNSADSNGRLIHAVSRYLTEVTSRHLVILQCHRRSS